MLACHRCKRSDRIIYTVRGTTWCRECDAYDAKLDIVISFISKANALKDEMHLIFRSECYYCPSDVEMQAERSWLSKLWHGRANDAEFVDEHCEYACSKHLSREFDFDAEKARLRELVANAPWKKKAQ